MSNENNKSRTNSNIQNLFNLAAAGKKLPLQAPVDEKGRQINDWNKYTSGLVSCQEECSVASAKKFTLDKNTWRK